MNLQDHFSIPPGLLYLNSGTLSICPKVVLEAVQTQQRKYEENPTEALFSTWPRLWQVQKELANHFGAAPADLFLRPNVTWALNTFILGVKLPSEGEIIVNDLEYGAIVNLCHLRAQRSGLRLRSIEVPLDFQTPEEVTDFFVSQLRPETRLLVVSHVMTGTGLVIPIREIAKETRCRDVLLAIDGAHAPGAVPLNFGDLSDVDFYGGNLHKWMLGPKGTGFGWAPKRIQDLIENTYGGWTTFEIPAPFAGFADGNQFAARMLTSSCHDFAPYFAIHEMLDFWKDYGPEILSQRASLMELLRKKMQEKVGWKCLSPDHPKMAGPLVTYELPLQHRNKGFALMRELLEKHHLQVGITQVKGEWVLRLSPHVYNSEEDIQRTVEILSTLNV